nr:MAG TPA: outer capsid protein sigma [Caudoviricetes sp.]
MRTTRAGFTDEDFYGSNDTDVVHFRYLHKLLRQVPTMTLSDVPDGKFTLTLDHTVTTSKYGNHTYKVMATTMDAAHTASYHVINPFIDDQLDKFYADVVKPQVDRLDKLIDSLTKVVKQQGESITTLQTQYSEQNKQLTALDQRLTALEHTEPTK